MFQTGVSVTSAHQISSEKRGVPEAFVTWTGTILARLVPRRQLMLHNQSVSKPHRNGWAAHLFRRLCTKVRSAPSAPAERWLSWDCWQKRLHTWTKSNTLPGWAMAPDDSVFFQEKAWKNLRIHLQFQQTSLSSLCHYVAPSPSQEVLHLFSRTCHIGWPTRREMEGTSLADLRSTPTEVGMR